MTTTRLSAITELPPDVIRPIARAVLLCCLLTLVGCGSGSGRPAKFPLNAEGRRPGEITEAQTRAVEETLGKLLGTPDEPLVSDDAGLDIERIRLATDGGRGPFRRHCVKCHGLSGGGDGPAAVLLDPYPRNFRKGLFKYTSTAGGAKPVEADLRRTLIEGVPDTAMPSFTRLPNERIDALVEYVKYLSIRGETELYLLALVVDEDEYLPVHELAALASDEGIRPAEQLWAEAPSMAVVPPPRPPTDTPELLAASIEKGRKLYAEDDAQCVKCHGPDGNGQGEEEELFDDWNKPKKGVTPQQTAELAERYTLPIQRLRPRNFREGIFRGGSRPIDLYWRIHVGLKGTPMPAAGPAPGVPGPYKPEDIWHVVNYVRSFTKTEK